MASSINGDGLSSRTGSQPVIVVDTNGFMMPFQFSINLDTELQRLFGFWKIIVPRCVLLELEALAANDPKAKAALKLASRYEIEETDQRGDDGILEALERRGGFLLTNDRELKKRARERGFPIIYLRKRSHLETMGLLR